MARLIFQFTCLPNGLSCAPRIFTKILKQVYAHLRVLGHTCMEHIDDSSLIARNYNDCVNNIHDTIGLFTRLHCAPREINFEASSRNRVPHGFIFHSLTMIV